MREWAMASAVLALAGCGPAGDPGERSAQDGASRAERDAFTAACRDELSFPDAGCACLLDKAQGELTTRQFRFVLAMVTKDDAAIASQREEISVEDAAAAAGFV
ncbi:MAG: hypothetical protein MI723_01245, partial [Caulobacterales bacterium]|nr:hypothetical protein [Caulobacterales bacterium]